MAIEVAIILLALSLVGGILSYTILRIVRVEFFRRIWMIVPLSAAALVVVSAYATVDQCSVREVDLSEIDMAELVADNATEIQKYLPANLAIGEIKVTNVSQESPLQWWQTLGEDELVKYSVTIGDNSDKRLLLLGLNRCGSIITHTTDF